MAALSPPLSAALSLVLAATASARPAPSPSPSPSPSPAPRFETAVDVEGEPHALPDTNVTAMKVGIPILRTPASVAVVPATLVEDQGGAVLSDSLRNVSGVGVGTVFGLFDHFVVRGFDSLSGGLVLTDAAAEPEATQYPLYNVERVEVLKGPSAFVYGGSPLGSVVHLVRKQPQDARFGELDVSFGSFGTWDARVDLNAARSGGWAAIRLNALSRGTDSWRDGRQGRLHAINPALRLTPSPSTRVDVNVEYLRSELAPDSGLPLSPFFTVPAVPRSRSFQSPLDDSRQNLWRLRLDADLRVSSATTLHGKIYYTDLDWDSTATLLSGLQPTGAGLAVNRSLAILDDRQRLLGRQFEAASRFSTWGADHRLLTGFENSRLTDRFRQDAALLPAIDLLLPVETAQPPARVIPGFSAAADATAFVTALYLVDRIAFSERLLLLLGARLDAIDYVDDATATERNATRVSPMGGVVVSPNDGLSLYVVASSAFAPPSSQVSGPRDPETSRQFELGAKASIIGGKGLATAAVYDLRRENIAIPDASGLLRQNGDQRSRGFELELRAETGATSVVAGYAFTDATMERFAERVVSFDPTTFMPVFTTIDRSGNAPPFAPRHLFNAWASHRFSAVELGAGLRLVGRQLVAEDNLVAIDSYALVDVMAAYRLGRARFIVNLHNVTGAEYASRGFGGSSVIPGSPFAAFARVEVGLGSR